MQGELRADRTKVNRVLWTIQGLLALLYLFTGVLKLVLPAAALAGPVHLPVLFLRFIGVCELLGAMGLMLPSVLRVLPVLTPIAACGLVIIMIGATTVTVIGHMPGPAMVPLCAGILAGLVAYGRSRVAPIRSRSELAAQAARLSPMGAA
jgi:DoxX-like family